MLQSKLKYQPNDGPIKYRIFRMVALFFAVTLAMVWTTAGAQITPNGAIEIEPGGKLWIEGSASIVDYTCSAERLSGNGNIENTTQPRQNVNGQGAVSIEVTIPVRSLECGKQAMNNDMYKALKANEHRSIRYQLLSASLVDTLNVNTATEEEEAWMNIKTTGVLEIAGAEDTTEVFVQGQLINENRFRVKGDKQISMKTYDIQPPTAMFGLIKARSELTVYFDVTVRLKNAFSGPGSR